MYIYTISRHTLYCLASKYFVQKKSVWAIIWPKLLACTKDSLTGMFEQSVACMSRLTHTYHFSICLSVHLSLFVCHTSNVLTYLACLTHSLEHNYFSYTCILLKRIVTYTPQPLISSVVQFFSQKCVVCENTWTENWRFRKVCHLSIMNHFFGQLIPVLKRPLFFLKDRCKLLYRF